MAVRAAARSIAVPVTWHEQGHSVPVITPAVSWRRPPRTAQNLLYTRIRKNRLSRMQQDSRTKSAAARSILQLRKLSSFSQLSFPPNNLKTVAARFSQPPLNVSFIPTVDTTEFCISLRKAWECQWHRRTGRRGRGLNWERIPVFTLRVRITTTNVFPGHSEHEAGEWGTRPRLRIVPCTMSLLFCPRARKLYRTESLYPPGHSVTAAVLCDTKKQTSCIRVQRLF